MSQPDTQAYRYDAFISYASADRERVRPLVDRLKADKCKIWLDEDDIPWGGAIRREVRRGLEESRHVILVISPASLGSEWVNLETLIASYNDPANRERKLLPLLLEECELPADLRIFKYLDVTTDEKLDESYPIILRQLAGKITKMRPVDGVAREVAATHLKELPPQKALRQELLKVIHDPTELAMFLRDSNINTARINLSGSIEIQVHNVLRHIKALGEASQLRFYRAVREEFLAAELHTLDLAIQRLGGDNPRHPISVPPPPKPAPHRDRAFVVNLQSGAGLSLPDSLPDGSLLELEDVFQIPDSQNVPLGEALRQVPIDVMAWTRVWTAIQKGIERALAGLKGALHIFAQAPHGVALLLGSSIGQLGRTADIRLYQWSPVTSSYMSWPLRAELPSGDFLNVEGLERVSGQGTVLSIELPRSATVDSLYDLGDETGARQILRLTPAGNNWINDETAAAGVVGDILGAIEGLPAGEPLMIVTSIPICGLVTLGKLLPPTVYPRVGIAHYDPSKARYKPVYQIQDGLRLMLPFPSTDVAPGGWPGEGHGRIEQRGPVQVDVTPQGQEQSMALESQAEVSGQQGEPLTGVPRPGDANASLRPPPKISVKQPSNEPAPKADNEPSDLEFQLEVRRFLHTMTAPQLIALAQQLDLHRAVNDRLSPEELINRIIENMLTRGRTGLEETLKWAREIIAQPGSFPVGSPSDVVSPESSSPARTNDERAIYELDRNDQWRALQDAVSQKKNGYPLIFIQGARGQGHHFFSLRIRQVLIEQAFPSHQRGEVICPPWDECRGSPADYYPSLLSALSPTRKQLNRGKKPLETLAYVLQERLKFEPVIILHQVIAMGHEDPIWESLLWEALRKIYDAVGKSPYPLRWIQPVSWQEFPTWQRYVASLIKGAGFDPKWARERCQDAAARALMRHPPSIRWDRSDAVHDIGSRGRQDLSMPPTLPTLWLSPLSPIQPGHVASYLRSGGFDEDEIERDLPEILSGGPNSQEIIRRLSEEWVNKPRSKV